MKGQSMLLEVQTVNGGKIIWVSRDKLGRYDIWSHKPQESNGWFPCGGKAKLLNTRPSISERGGVCLKRRQVAKVHLSIIAKVVKVYNAK